MTISRHIRFFATITGVLIVACFSAHAGDAPESPFSHWQHPTWFDAIEGVTISFDVNPEEKAADVAVAFEYSTGEKGDAPAVADASAPGRYTAKVPGLSEPTLAMLSVTALATVNGKAIRSAPVTIAAAYVNEFDVTGNPPVVLPYALPDDAYLARYIPCCNIFGGTLIGKRIQVLPTDSRDGLPEKLLSDFVDLEPDELTESTAGLHMQFRYDPATVKEQGVAQVGLYTWDIRAWREVHAYDVNTETGMVDLHCPTGGIFVLAEKVATN